MNSVESQYKRGQQLHVEAALRKHPDYFAFEQYMTTEARDIISETSSGIRITPTVVIGAYETVEEKAFRVLKQEIARIEKERDSNP